MAWFINEQMVSGYFMRMRTGLLFFREGFRILYEDKKFLQGKVRR